MPSINYLGVRKQITCALALASIAADECPLEACGGHFEKLSGIIEIDKTYVGGKEANKHADKKLRAGRGTSPPGLTKPELSREFHSLRLRRRSGAQELVQSQQIHGAQGHARVLPAPHRVLNDDRLFSRGRFHRRVQDGRRPFAGTPKRIESQLIEHLARQRLFPQVPILRVQHSDCLPTSHQHEIRTEYRISPAKRILAQSIPEHSLKAMFVMDLNAAQILPQKSGQECLKKAVHVEEEALQSQPATFLVQRHALA